LAKLVTKRRETMENEKKERELDRSILDQDGNVSKFKEFYLKKVLPKASKLTKEIH
jgi:hypothetical protein